MQTRTHVLGPLHALRTHLRAHAPLASSRTAALRHRGWLIHHAQRLPVLLVLLTLPLGGSLVHAGDPTTSGSTYTQWECIRHDSDDTYDHE
jgi:hypothetical protein